MWEDLDYVDAETNARRRAVPGYHCLLGGPELTDLGSAVAAAVILPTVAPTTGPVLLQQVWPALRVHL